ncbi:MAG: hypothetical protein ACKO0Z_02300 [Betaproteobacteria bacterium]
MKTDQLLTLTFSGATVTLNHANAYGDLTSVLDAANKYRVDDNDGKAIQLASLLSSDGFTRQVELLCEDGDFSVDPRGAYYKVGKGRNTRTEAHIVLLLYVAQVVSPRFHYEFNKRVVLENLCRWRDESGNEFIALNAALEMHSAKVLGKPAHQGHYIQMAKALRAKILPPEHLGWNFASADELRKRTEAEQTLVKLLQLGVVRDWEHLKELIEKL